MTIEEPMTVAEAARAGDHLAMLRALRQRLADAVTNPDVSARDLAALARRLVDVSTDLQDVEAIEASEMTFVEELAYRRMEETAHPLGDPNRRRAPAALEVPAIPDERWDPSAI